MTRVLSPTIVVPLCVPPVPVDPPVDPPPTGILADYFILETSRSINTMFLIGGLLSTIALVCLYAILFLFEEAPSVIRNCTLAGVFGYIFFVGCSCFSLHTYGLVLGKE